MKTSEKDLKFLKEMRKKSEDYKKGFIDGYGKARKDFKKIKIKFIKMKTEKIKEFKEEVENWLNFNKNKLPINLLELSQLIAIFRKYYFLRAKWERKKK